MKYVITLSCLALLIPSSLQAQDVGADWAKADCNYKGGSWNGYRCVYNNSRSRSNSIDDAYGQAIWGLLKLYSQKNKTRKRTSYGRYTLGKVNHPKGYAINLRSSPSFSHNRVIQIPSHAQNLRVFGCKKFRNDDGYRSWCKLSYNGTEGWVSAKYLSPVK